MEFKEVVGTRRSVRIWQPWRPVEDAKLQQMLEAVYRAPRVLEIDFVRTVMMRRDSLTTEQRQALKTPTTSAQIDLCPVVMWICADLDALERALDGRVVEELIEVGALNASHGWSRDHVQDAVIPKFYRGILDDPDRIPVSARPAGGDANGTVYSRSLVAYGRTAIGMAQATAMLTAVDLGLGVQLSALPDRASRELLGVPDSWISSSPLFIGYSAEQPGGQRPREPLEETAFEGRYGHPFQSDPKVVESLREAGMIQDPAPLPWRRAELRRLARMFGLPE